MLIRPSFLYRYIYGYDFFISYCRADGISSALILANLLIARGHTAYIDQWGSEPDQKAPKSLLVIVPNARLNPRMIVARGYGHEMDACGAINELPFITHADIRLRLQK